MKFEQIAIKNFRNFENIEICISNKNIFFGLNDIGKTNFLYALRYVFDKDIRKNGFLDSDFHRKNVASPIEITVVIDISDTADPDSQKLRAQLKGALFSHQNKVYIKLTAQYDAQELVAMPLMYWGGNLEHLYEIKQRGYRYDIDFIFTVTYIDSYVDLYSLFKKNISSLIKHGTASDDTALKHIQSSIDALNANIANLPSVKDFEQKITPEYQKFRSEDISIAIKSEIAVKGLYSSIVPYIKRTDDENLYPTAGEGRKKLLAYSIFDLLSTEREELQINLFLIEEPENHLHKSLQIALSQILFAVCMPYSCISAIVSVLILLLLVMKSSQSILGAEHILKHLKAFVTSLIFARSSWEITSVHVSRFKITPTCFSQKHARFIHQPKVLTILFG